MPEDVPPPEQCPKLGEVLFKASGRPISFWERSGELDVRYVGDSRPGGVLANTRHPARARMWVRADGSLPDDRRLHHAALAYASDLTLLSATTVPHGVLIGLNVQAASIDHAMWFHRPFRADEWLLYDQVSPSASMASDSRPAASSKTESWCPTSPKKASSALSARHNQKRAIRRGNPDRPWGCWEVALRSLARGGYAARTDFPRSLAMAWRSI